MCCFSYLRRKIASMNILFLLGNGFDKNLGFPTSYAEFYDYYLSDKLNQNLYDENVAKLKKEIGENKADWADLELQMGRYLTQVESEQAADSLHRSIKFSLIEYLNSVLKDFSCNDAQRKKFVADLISPEKYLLVEDRNTVSEYKNKDTYKKVDVISFNYDDIFETIVGLGSTSVKLNDYYTLTGTIHVHGTLKEGLIIGLDNEEQFHNSSLLQSSLLRNKYIKSNYCKIARDGRDRKCRSLINSANIIYMYGLSIGETDKRWWKYIAERLKASDAKLIIFWFDKDSRFTSQDLVEQFEEEQRIKKMFLSHSGFGEDIVQMLQDQIYVKIFTSQENGFLKI